MLPRPVQIEVPCKDKWGHPDVTPQSVVNLAELTECMGSHYPTHFEVIFGTNPRGFWEALHDDDPKFLAINALRADPTWMDTTYPFVLHGDGGVYTKKTQSSIPTVSIKSLLSEPFQGNTLPIFCLPKDMRSADTAGFMWRMAVHFLNACYDGVHPLKRDNEGNDWPADSPQARLAGRPILGGRARIVVWIVTGDLEFLGNELGFPHFNTTEPCWMCPVCRREGPYSLTDLSLDAGWKRQLVTSAEGIWVPPTDHPISSLRGFTRFAVPGELMHTGVLGVLCWFLGAVIWELMHDGVWEGGIDQRLQQLWSQILIEYDAQQIKNRLSKLTVSMFSGGTDQWACFTGKAAETTSLLYVLRNVCGVFQTGSYRDHHRGVCFDMLCWIFDTCESNGPVLPRPVAEEMLARYDRFLIHYNWLAHNSARLGRMNYNIVTKTHMMWHICYHARWLNPRLCWAYEFEDFAGTMITAAKACMAGSPLRIVGGKVLQHFLLVLQLRLRH